MAKSIGVIMASIGWRAMESKGQDARYMEREHGTGLTRHLLGTDPSSRVGPTKNKQWHNLIFPLLALFVCV